MDILLEFPQSPAPVAAVAPVLSLANDGKDAGGRWITVNNAHIFIKDGGGSQHDQVTQFLSKRAHGSGKSEDHEGAAAAHEAKAKSTGALEDHASAAAHHHSGTAYDALKGGVKQKMDEAHQSISAGMKHVQDVAEKVKNYPGEKLSQAKGIINKGVERTQEIAKAAAAYPGKKLSEAKQAIGDKVKAIGEDVGAKKSWLASKFHSAAAIAHQVAGDLHGLAGNHIMQAAHEAMAEKHLDERDKHLGVVAEHASKVAAAHTAASTFGKDQEPAEKALPAKAAPKVATTEKENPESKGAEPPKEKAPKEPAPKDDGKHNAPKEAPPKTESAPKPAKPVATASQHFDNETKAATAHVDAQLAHRHVDGHDQQADAHGDQAAQHAANAHTLAHTLLDHAEAHARTAKAMGHDHEAANAAVKKEGSPIAQQAMKFAQAHYAAAKASVKAGDKETAHGHLLKMAALAALAHKTRADELNKTGDLEGERKHLLAAAHAQGQLLALKSAKPEQIMTHAEAKARHDAMIQQHAADAAKATPKPQAPQDKPAPKDGKQPDAKPEAKPGGKGGKDQKGDKNPKDKPAPKDKGGAGKDGKPEHDGKPHGKAAHAEHGHAAHGHAEHGEHGHGEHGAHGGRGGGMGAGMRSGMGGGGGQQHGQRRKIMMPKRHLGLSLMDSVDNYLLMPGQTSEALALSDQTTADGKPIKRFRKEIIREGDFQKAADNLAFTVTKDSLDHWVNTFGEMQKNKVDVYFPAGHTNRPEANRGYWRKLEVAPSTKNPAILALWGEVDAIGEDAIGLIGRTDVSLYSPRELVDGEGHKYRRPIVHIAACVDPVIPGLGEWQSVAASLEAGDAEAGAPPVTVLIPWAPTADDAGNVTMIADGLKPDEGSEVIEESVLRDFMRGLKRGERIAGIKYLGGLPHDPAVDDSMDVSGAYEGIVRRVRDTNTANSSADHVTDAPRNITVVVYDTGKMGNDLEDVLSSEPHIMFVRYRAEVDAGDAKPTSLSLDGKGNDGEDGKQDTTPEEQSSEKNADNEEDAKNKVADKLADDAEFVAEAQARSRGVNPEKDDADDDDEDDADDDDEDDDDEDCSLSLAWNKGTPMADTLTLPVDQQSDDSLVASLEAAAEGGDAAAQAAISAEIEKRVTPASDSTPAEPAAVSLSTAASEPVAVAVSEPTDGVPATINDDGNVALSQAAATETLPETAAAAVAEPVAQAAPAAAVVDPPPARKGINIAVILNRLGYEDLSTVTAENAEEMILSGIDALEAKITEEADQALSLSRQEFETALTTAQGSSNGRHVSDIEVGLKTENLNLRLNNLVDAGRLTPVAKDMILSIYDSNKLTLSLSQGDDTLDKMLEVIAHNEPVVLTELTGAQAKGAVRLSRKTGKAEPLPTDEGGEAGGANPDLMADADRRRKEWEAQKAAAERSR